MRRESMKKRKKKKVAVFKVAEAPTVRGFCYISESSPELEKELQSSRTMSE